MNYMNDFEIMGAQARWKNHPVLSKAAQFLAAFKEQVDNNSDGWAYWKAPVAAANKLMCLLQNPPANVTEADLKKALAPIKAFYTRRGNAAGMQMPVIF